MLRQESFASCVTHKISFVQISESNRAELSTSLYVLVAGVDRENRKTFQQNEFSARAQLVSNRHVLDASDEARTHARNRSAELDRFEPRRELTKH